MVESATSSWRRNCTGAKEGGWREDDGAAVEFSERSPGLVETFSTFYPRVSYSLLLLDHS